MAFFKTFACFSAQFQIMNRCFFLADTPQKADEIHQAMFFEYPCTMLHSVLVSSWAILSLNSHELFCHFLN